MYDEYYECDVNLCHWSAPFEDVKVLRMRYLYLVVSPN